MGILNFFSSTSSHKGKEINYIPVLINGKIQYEERNGSKGKYAHVWSVNLPKKLEELELFMKDPKNKESENFEKVLLEKLYEIKLKLEGIIEEYPKNIGEYASTFYDVYLAKQICAFIDLLVNSIEFSKYESLVKPIGKAAYPSYNKATIPKFSIEDTNQSFYKFIEEAYTVNLYRNFNQFSVMKEMERLADELLSEEELALKNRVKALQENRKKHESAVNALELEKIKLNSETQKLESEQRALDAEYEELRKLGVVDWLFIKNYLSKIRRIICPPFLV